MGLNLETGEILLVNKPYGWTSFDVVGKFRSMVRKHAGIRKLKTGHAGTLDPLATGLLILCTGRFTKRIEEFQGLEKEYTGTFRLGATTPSFDLETEVDRTYTLTGWGDPDGVGGPRQGGGTPMGWQRLAEAANHFTGTFDQVPPTFSAIWVDGKRAYLSARKDIALEIKPRQVTISAFEITRFELPDVDFRIACSKGTYIRALARDFGEYLGCGAHLTALCRTRIGPYHLRDAYSIADLERLLSDQPAPSGHALL
ncbi:MAG TPA: tRNA pseudouridine(55) synthase TruB [Bacteroidales bacterium]|nr:tRNA pseudouridine(55) synthase TruB [Bacteroidales bacterium]